MEDILSRLSKSTAKAKPFGAVIKFDCAPDGVVIIDGRGEAITLSDTDQEADTTLVLSRDNLEKLLRGKLNPAMALMSGKLKVQGDMGLAMKLAAFI